MSKHEKDTLSLGIDAIEKDEAEYSNGIIWSEEDAEMIAENLEKYERLKVEIPIMEQETEAFYEMVENSSGMSKNVLRMISILLSKQEDINDFAKEQMSEIVAYLASKNIYV